jgi:membrane protease YdiL (CAAX protease family)
MSSTGIAEQRRADSPPQYSASPAPRSPARSQRPTWERIILLILLGYEALGCLSGGSLLVLAPDGHLTDMQVEGMDGFFPDFFVPGLLLMGLGILNVVAFTAVWRKHRTDWLLSGLALGGLTVWFTVEIAVVGPHWLQAMWGLPVLIGVVMALPLIPSQAEGRPFIRSHPVLTYYILTFAISWGGILLVILGGHSSFPATPEQFNRLIPIAIVTLLTGPPVACLLLTGLVEGRAGYAELGGRLLRWRVGAAWYALALLAAPTAFAAASFGMSFASPVYLPAILTRADKAAVLFLATAPALLVGFAEELGWTGFAVPRLRRRHGVLATGLTAGVLWGTWHLLTNDLWAANVIADGLPVGVMVTLSGLSLLTTELLVYRVLIVWVYDHTGSLPVAMLMHAAFAFGTFALQPDGVSGVPLLVHGVLVSALLWLVVTAVAVGTRGQFIQRRLQTATAQSQYQWRATRSSPRSPALPLPNRPERSTSVCDRGTSAGPYGSAKSTRAGLSRSSIEKAT